MNATRLKHNEFALKVAHGENASKAYADVYKKKPSHSTESAASRLLKNVEVQDGIKKKRKSIRKQMMAHSQWAYDRLIGMVDSPTVPANIKEKILNNILQVSGVTVVQKTENVQVIKQEELQASPEEIKQWLDEITIMPITGGVDK